MLSVPPENAGTLRGILSQDGKILEASQSTLQTRETASYTFCGLVPSDYKSGSCEPQFLHPIT